MNWHIIEIILFVILFGFIIFFNIVRRNFSKWIDEFIVSNANKIDRVEGDNLWKRIEKIEEKLKKHG